MGKNDKKGEYNQKDYMQALTKSNSRNDIEVNLVIPKLKGQWLASHQKKPLAREWIQIQ